MWFSALPFAHAAIRLSFNFNMNGIRQKKKKIMRELRRPLDLQEITISLLTKQHNLTFTADFYNKLKLYQ